MAGCIRRGSGERINSLELRAILACLRWRCEHTKEHNCRFLRLTDSLVCIHSLTRGRTSSRRLRRTLCRINSLMLAHNIAGLWGYVHIDLNPSRWSACQRSFLRDRLGPIYSERKATARQLTQLSSTTCNTGTLRKRFESFPYRPP